MCNVKENVHQELFVKKTVVLASEDSMLSHCIVTPGLRSIQQKVILKRHHTPCNRPLSHSGHFESQEIKKLCFCSSSLALDER